jgi:hypothetical protein
MFKWLQGDRRAQQLKSNTGSVSNSLISDQTKAKTQEMADAEVHSQRDYAELRYVAEKIKYILSIGGILMVNFILLLR